MEFFTKTLNIVKQSSQCLVIGVYQGKRPKLSLAGQELDEASGKQLSRLLAQGDLTGAVGSSMMVYDPLNIAARRILLLGLGEKKKISSKLMRKVARLAAKVLNKASINSADFTLLELVSDAGLITRQAKNIVEAMDEALYSYQETKSGKKEKVALNKVSLVTDRKNLSAAKAGIVQGVAIANGVSFTKTISNLPGNICTPSYLARQAKALQKSHGLKTTVLDEAQMKKLKMGSLLSVSRGSREPAKFIIMEHKGGKKGDAPVVLVGKGLTFDAGGISIKPSAGMDEMKYDMCGGASVFGAMIAATEMKLPLNVIGVVPSSENLPDGAANKPGDIVTSMKGTTIEILNTDAEGRLILCDALTYVERYKPAAVVDIATLTGACIIALGHHTSGLFSNTDKLAKEIMAAGESSGDQAWQLPLGEAYSAQLKSNFADFANIGGRSAGSITAACFLQHFAEKYDWAHLDVAGTAWKSAGPKGATGRPVPLLVEFLLGRC
jgi:leucyl aminopeptidase